MLLGEVRDKLEARIISKSWENEAYKAELMRDPTTVIRREIQDVFGTQDMIPGDCEISVHEEAVGSFHFVIPRHPDEQPDVLSVQDVSPITAQQCNTPDSTRCGCCSITAGAQSKCQ